MHHVKRVWQWMMSAMVWTWQHIRAFPRKFGRLLKEIRSSRGHDPIPALGIVIGTLAFGFWWQSFAAALFGAIALFFLAGIYKNGERMASAVLISVDEPREEQSQPRIYEQRVPENSEAVKHAIASLRPWLSNEISLTEENAKHCCSVLLESVATDSRRVDGF